MKRICPRTQKLDEVNIRQSCITYAIIFGYSLLAKDVVERLTREWVSPLRQKELANLAQ